VCACVIVIKRVRGLFLFHFFALVYAVAGGAWLGFGRFWGSFSIHFFFFARHSISYFPLFPYLFWFFFLMGFWLRGFFFRFSVSWEHHWEAGLS